jgi:putative solute:sodium symporter small subunit
MAQSAGSIKTTRTEADAKKGDVAGYWRANLRLIGVLLVIWFAVSYLPVFIVRLLNQVNILTGFPVGYYMGAQGSLIVFVVLIFVYARRMARLDREYGLDDD